MMAHVWNEIEYALGYKPFSGSLSQFERDQLRHLGTMVRAAADTISYLLAATDQRLAAETTPFADVYDFVARLRPWFLGVDFGRHAGPLFETLRPLRLLNPDAIRRQIDPPEPLSGHAKERLEQLVTAGVFFNSLQNLQPNSSDLLLVALLPKMARIFARDSSQDPGIARIREMAQDYIATTTKAGSESRASDA